jgi:hypothetical protein
MNKYTAGFPPPDDLLKWPAPVDNPTTTPSEPESHDEPYAMIERDYRIEVFQKYRVIFNSGCPVPEFPNCLQTK